MIERKALAFALCQEEEQHDQCDMSRWDVKSHSCGRKDSRYVTSLRIPKDPEKVRIMRPSHRNGTKIYRQRSSSEQPIPMEEK